MHIYTLTRTCIPQWGPRCTPAWDTCPLWFILYLTPSLSCSPALGTLNFKQHQSHLGTCSEPQAQLTLLSMPWVWAGPHHSACPSAGDPEATDLGPGLQKPSVHTHLLWNRPTLLPCLGQPRSAAHLSSTSRSSSHVTCSPSSH